MREIIQATSSITFILRGPDGALKESAGNLMEGESENADDNANSGGNNMG